MLEPAPGDERVDLRELATFTIDPDDARDFDDAISARRNDDGTIRVSVHIADVSAYVTPGGAIETEAERRGTSVYVPGAVEPMLPEALSNGACSLRPGEDKLAVTVEMDMAGTDVRRVRFLRTLIRSDRRLTYGQVDEIFAGGERAEDPGAARWRPHARWPPRWPRSGASRRAGGRQQGAVVRLRRDGHVTGVHHEEQTESHELIEHLMILANEQVAGYLADRKLPTLYRVHEKPDPLKVAAMAEQLASLDVPTPPVPEPMSPQQAADVAAEASRLARGGGAPERARRHRVRLTGAALAQAGLLLPAQPGPRRPGQRPLLPLHLAHPALPRPGGPPRPAGRAGPGRLPRRAPRDMDEAGIEASAREREAMKIERSADDVCLAFLLERSIDPDDPVYDGEVVGLVAGSVRPLRPGFEGSWASADSRLVRAERAGHRAGVRSPLDPHGRPRAGGGGAGGGAAGAGRAPAGALTGAERSSTRARCRQGLCPTGSRKGSARPSCAVSACSTSRSASAPTGSPHSASWGLSLLASAPRRAGGG